MNRNFVYRVPSRTLERQQSAWKRAGGTLNRWLWAALCCGHPGVPCVFCNCCERLEERDRERPRVNRNRQCEKYLAQGMNITFVYHVPSQTLERHQSAWKRAGGTLNRWLWVALCCGHPGVPCVFCDCCERLEERDRERPRVNQSTATVERTLRLHRPHAPRGRKPTPEMLSAVRCALSQLQGEPAPPNVICGDIRCEPG